MTWPVSSMNSRSSSAGTLSAPARHSLSEAKSSPLAAPSRTRAKRAEGSMQSTVGRSSRRSGRISSAKTLRATTARAPTESAAKENMKPPMWEMDEPGSTTSAAVISKARAAQANI
jgi:hypothetical protein